MKTFNNMRARAFAKKWDAFFIVSDRKKKAFASAFVDLGQRHPLTFLEAHGKPEQVGKDLRAKLIKLGVLQDGPGAPKGNANAAGEHEMTAKPIAARLKRLKKKRETAKVFNVPFGSGAKPVKAKSPEVIGLPETKVQVAIDRVIESTNNLDAVLAKEKKSEGTAAQIQVKTAAPRMITIQSTTKLVDGKLSTSVAKKNNVAVHEAAAAQRALGDQVKMNAGARGPAKNRPKPAPSMRLSRNRRAAAEKLKATKKPANVVRGKKRSHHKKVA